MDEKYVGHPKEREYPDAYLVECEKIGKVGETECRLLIPSQGRVLVSDVASLFLKSPIGVTYINPILGEPYLSAVVKGCTISELPSQRQNITCGER